MALIDAVNWAERDDDSGICVRSLGGAPLDSVSAFEKTEVSCALQTDESQTELPSDANQLILFNF